MWAAYWSCSEKMNSKPEGQNCLRVKLSLSILQAILATSPHWDPHLINIVEIIICFSNQRKEYNDDVSYCFLSISPSLLISSLLINLIHVHYIIFRKFRRKVKKKVRITHIFRSELTFVNISVSFRFIFYLHNHFWLSVCLYFKKLNDTVE